jgi:hypothetical protein
MSIAITQENLPKFSKRLQRALQAKLGVDIGLSDCTTLLAQSLGATNTHQLMQWMSAPASKEASATSQDPAMPQAQLFLDWFNSNIPPNTAFERIELAHANGDIGLHLQSQSKKYRPDQESFGIYWDDSRHPSSYVANELSRLVCTPADEKFIQDLVAQFFPVDDSERKILGIRLAKRVGIHDVQSFCLYQAMDRSREITQVGHCKEVFLSLGGIVISENQAVPGFIESMVEVPSRHIHATFEAAYQHAKKERGNLVHGFMHPQSKRLVFDWCLSQDDRLKSLPSGIELPYKEKSDIYVFEGMLAARNKKGNSINPYAINEDQHVFWEKGCAEIRKLSVGRPR